MSPLSALAVTRVAGQAVSTAGRVATHSVDRFAELFAEVAGVSDAEAAEAAHCGSGQDETSTLVGSIVDRLRTLLAQAGSPSDQPLTLQLSPLGNVYVDAPLESRGSIEAAVESDGQLQQWLGRWASLTGQSSFRYDGQTASPLRSA